MKKQKPDENEMVACATCSLPVSVRSGWYDPYNKKMYLTKGSKGAYVHFECLSEKRKKELKQQTKEIG